MQLFNIQKKLYIYLIKLKHLGFLDWKHSLLTWWALGFSTQLHRPMKVFLFILSFFQGTLEIHTPGYFYLVLRTDEGLIDIPVLDPDMKTSFYDI